jgi:hypothetical protein
LRPIIKLFFPHPSKGASLLYDAALGENKERSGAYLVNGRQAGLHFTEQGGKVLEKVRLIYEQEFAADAARK